MSFDYSPFELLHGSNWGVRGERWWQGPPGLSGLSTELTPDHELSIGSERRMSLEKFVISFGTICREVLLPSLGPTWASTLVAPTLLCWKESYYFPDVTNSGRATGKLPCSWQPGGPLQKAVRCRWPPPQREGSQQVLQLIQETFWIQSLF